MMSQNKQKVHNHLKEFDKFKEKRVDQNQKQGRANMGYGRR